MKESLELRKKIKARKPKFRMQNSGRLARLDDKWRKPKGIDSKLRLRYARRKTVTPGYGSPKDVKYLNRNGFKEIIVNNVNDLENVDKNCVAIIASTVGKLKKLKIIEVALSKDIKISNIKDPKKYSEKVKKQFEKVKKEKEKKSEDKKVKKKEDKKDKESIEDKLSDDEKKKQEKKEVDRLLTKKF